MLRTVFSVLRAFRMPPRASQHFYNQDPPLLAFKHSGAAYYANNVPDFLASIFRGKFGIFRVEKKLPS
jgi:hypothetical protein